jgi:hypothetical protein
MVDKVYRYVLWSVTLRQDSTFATIVRISEDAQFAIPISSMSGKVKISNTYRNRMKDGKRLFQDLCRLKLPLHYLWILERRVLQTYLPLSILFEKSR